MKCFLGNYLQFSYWQPFQHEFWFAWINKTLNIVLLKQYRNQASVDFVSIFTQIKDNKDTCKCLPIALFNTLAYKEDRNQEILSMLIHNSNLVYRKDGGITQTQTDGTGGYLAERARLIST